MMGKIRIFALGLALFSVVSAWALDYKGKTSSQILAMGSTQWMEYATAKDGSTAGMANASYVWTEVLRKRNDAKAAKLATTARDNMNGIRYDLGRLTDISHTVGISLSGGGTMWILFTASSHSLIEEVMSDILRAGPPLAEEVKLGSLSDLNSAINSLEQKVLSAKTDIEGNQGITGLSYNAVRLAVSDLRKVTLRLGGRAKQLSETDQMQIYGMGRRAVDSATLDGATR